MNRPYKAPASVSAKHKTWHYFIRCFTSTDRLACAVHLPAHPQARRQDVEITDQVTDQVTMEVMRLLVAGSQGDQPRSALQSALGLKHTPHFRQAYLLPALAQGLMEMTLPDQPNSRLQRYRLTPKGRQWLKNL